jgi:hypothetical protein
MNTQLIKSAPGPWEDNGSGLIYGQVSGDDDEAPFVADVCNDGSSGEYTEQEQANARHIVKCVNLHDELVGALRTVVEMELDRDEESRNFDEERLEYFSSLITQAEGRPA